MKWAITIQIVVSWIPVAAAVVSTVRIGNAFYQIERFDGKVCWTLNETWSLSSRHEETLNKCLNNCVELNGNCTSATYYKNGRCSLFSEMCNTPETNVTGAQTYNFFSPTNPIPIIEKITPSARTTKMTTPQPFIRPRTLPTTTTPDAGVNAFFAVAGVMAIVVVAIGVVVAICVVAKASANRSTVKHSEELHHFLLKVTQATRPHEDAIRQRLQKEFKQDRGKTFLQQEADKYHEQDINSAQETIVYIAWQGRLKEWDDKQTLHLHELISYLPLSPRDLKMQLTAGRGQLFLKREAKLNYNNDRKKAETNINYIVKMGARKSIRQILEFYQQTDRKHHFTPHQSEVPNFIQDPCASTGALASRCRDRLDSETPEFCEDPRVSQSSDNLLKGIQLSRLPQT